MVASAFSYVAVIMDMVHALSIIHNSKPSAGVNANLMCMQAKVCYLRIRHDGFSGNITRGYINILIPRNRSIINGSALLCDNEQTPCASSRDI